MENEMSIQIFTGSKAYTTRKVRELQSRGWVIISQSVFKSSHYGDKYTYKMEYVGRLTQYISNQFAGAR